MSLNFGTEDYCMRLRVLFDNTLFERSISVHLGRNFPGDASRIVRLSSDEDHARLLQVIEKQVAQQEVAEVVYSHGLLEPVSRPSRLLVLPSRRR